MGDYTFLFLWISYSHPNTYLNSFPVFSDPMFCKCIPVKLLCFSYPYILQSYVPKGASVEFTLFSKTLRPLFGLQRKRKNSGIKLANFSILWNWKQCKVTWDGVWQELRWITGNGAARSFWNLNYTALKAKLAITSVKVLIYIDTCVCLAYISFADLQSAKAQTHHSKHTFPLFVCIP